MRWDKHGVWLCVRRLHKGHFRWPRAGDKAWSLTQDEFNWLITGVDWQQLNGPCHGAEVVDENLQKNTELLAKEQRISLLEEALRLARQQRQLFEEDTEADIAAAETQLNALLQQDIKENAEKPSASRPVRKALPSQLRRVKKTIPPASDTCVDCNVALRFIRDEISEKLEYIRGQPVRPSPVWVSLL